MNSVGTEACFPAASYYWTSNFCFLSLVVFFFFLNICANARKYHRFQPHFSFPSSHHEQNMLPEMLASALVIMYSLFSCVRSWLTEGRKGYLG